MKELNSTQIIRFDGKNCFVEILNTAFTIGKICMNFIEYDLSKEKKNRIKQQITIYLDISDFLVLYRDISSGRLSALAQQSRQIAKQKGYKFCAEIYKDIGGVSAENLKKRGKERPDGKSLSRQFKITPGASQPWLFSAECGPGEENEKKLIVPKYVNKKPENIVRVALQDNDLKKFAEVIYIHLSAFYAYQYTNNINNINNIKKS